MYVRLQIHPKYKWRACDGAFCRTNSPFHQKIAETGLLNIECPCCGGKSLDVMNFGDDEYDPKRIVGCRACDWIFPVEDMTSYGGAISEAEEWLEAFYLLGKPKNRLYEDLRKEFRM